MLFVQYSRFNNDGTKVNHNIGGGTVLRLPPDYKYVYDLVGVLVHSGSPNSGHYYSVTVCPPYDETHKAYLCDDFLDTQISIGEARLGELYNKGYMLAYELRPVSTVPVTTNMDLQNSSEEVHAKDTSQSPTTHAMNSVEEKEFRANIAERDAILSIPNAKRSHWQHARYVSLKKSIAKDKDKFPHIPVKMLAMTPAEKKAAQRKRKSDAEREEEREANRARMATPEAKEATRARMKTPKAMEATRARNATPEAKDATRARMATPEAKDATRARMATPEAKDATRARMATPEAKEATRARMATPEAKEATRARLATDEALAADKQRKTAKRAGVKVSPRDGLNAELVLNGQFCVELHSLGSMEKVLKKRRKCIIKSIHHQLHCRYN